ncbi:hypothetical protein SCUP515_08179 [Seiridium cupressi]
MDSTTSVIDSGGPLLSDVLFKYRQYKDDTESIAGWLAENAIKCGFEVNSEAPTVPSTTRTKGNIRKQAGKGKGAPQHIIKVSDFVSMAKVIAEHTPKVDVPAALNRIFRRAIDARREFTDWFSKNSPGNKANNERHTYFSDVLNSAWETLLPFQEARNTSRLPAATSTDDKGEAPSGLSNRFSGLDIEHSKHSDEPTESPMPANDGDTKLRDVLKVKLEKDEDEIEQQFFFATRAFADELNLVRTLIKHVYQEYADARVDSSRQAAVLTNTAIQLVRRAEISLDMALERPAKYPAETFPVWTLLNLLMFHQLGALESQTFCESKKLKDMAKPTWTPPKPSDPVFDSQGGDEKRWKDYCFWDTWNALKGAINKSQPERGQAGMSLGAIDCEISAKGDEELLKKLRLFNCLQLTLMGPIFSVDEVTRGVRIGVETNTVPAWAVLGFQSLLDIQQILGEELDSPMIDLTVNVSEMKQRWDTDIESGKLFPNVGPKPPHIRALRAFLAEMEGAILEDGFRQALMNSLDPMTLMMISRYLKEPFALKQNPVLSGLLDYTLYIQLHNRAIDMDTGLLVMTPILHLYRACRLAYPEAPAWPDMEFVMRCQDSKSLFFGGIPTTLKESAMKYTLSVGGSLAMFAKHRRKAPFHMDWNKLRLVSNCLTVGNVLSPWLGGPSEDVDGTVLKLIQFLDDPKSHTTLYDRINMPEEERKRQRDDYSLPHTSIVYTLASMRMFLEAEHEVMAFDWISFMQTCNEIANKMAQDLPDYGHNSKVPCGTILDVLWEAMTAEEAAKRAKAPDVLAAARAAAPGLDYVQKVFQAALCNGPVEHDQSAGYSRKKTRPMQWWHGDREIARTVFPYGRPVFGILGTRNNACFPQTLYANWAPERLKCSLVAQQAHGDLDLDLDDDDDEQEDDESEDSSW